MGLRIQLLEPNQLAIYVVLDLNSRLPKTNPASGLGWTQQTRGPRIASPLLFPFDHAAPYVLPPIWVYRIFVTLFMGTQKGSIKLKIKLMVYNKENSVIYLARCLFHLEHLTRKETGCSQSTLKGHANILSKWHVLLFICWRHLGQEIVTCT